MQKPIIEEPAEISSQSFGKVHSILQSTALSWILSAHIKETNNISLQSSTNTTLM